MKKIVIPTTIMAIVLIAGFSGLQTMVSGQISKGGRKGKIIRTDDGLVAIPSDVQMSKEDAKAFFDSAKEIGGDSFSLVYFDNKKPVFLGNGINNIEDFKTMGKYYEVPMETTSKATLFGFGIFKEMLVRSKVKDDNKFKEVTVFLKSAGKIEGRTTEAERKISEIIRKYSR